MEFVALLKFVDCFLVVKMMYSNKTVFLFVYGWFFLSRVVSLRYINERTVAIIFKFWVCCCLLGVVLKFYCYCSVFWVVSLLKLLSGFRSLKLRGYSCTLF